MTINESDLAEKVVKLVNGPGEYTFVFGTRQEEKLPVIYEPTPVKFDGNIFAPAEWAERRSHQIDINESHVEVSRGDKSAKIDLIVGELDPKVKTIISGTVKTDPAFDRFRINDEIDVSAADMANRLMKCAAYFEVRSEAALIVQKLRNLKVKRTIDVKNEDDLRGNQEALFKSVIKDSNIPESFKIIVPVFSGAPKVTLSVSINVNAEDLSVTLFSEDAYFEIDKSRDEIVNAVIERIKNAAPGIPVLER